MNKAITLEQLQQLAEEFGYNPTTVRAVLEVEAPKGGFLPDGRVTILFERHIFFRLATGLTLEERRTNTDICNKTPGGYLGGAKEWDRIEKAMALDRNSALKSASYGRGQIMGFHFALIGYPTVSLMVEDFAAGEMAQVRGMLRFIRSNKKLDRVMQEPRPTPQDFIVFASGYNGKGYALNKYDLKLAAAYDRLTHA